MNERHLTKWEKTRAKGKSEFILRDGGVIFGLLVFGFLMPVLTLVVRFVLHGFNFTFLDKEFLVRIIFGLIIAFPFGCLWGWLTWEFNEWSYKRHRQKLK